jgi:pimeloyl-ACP methyl ester carboxylesterase
VSSALTWVVRALLGLLVLGAGALGIYECIALFSWDRWLALKAIPILLLFALSVVAIDNGLGLVLHRNEPVQLVFMDRDKGAPNRLFFLDPGYNGNGEALVQTLGPALRHLGDVLSFRPPRGGFDRRRINQTIHQVFIQRNPEQIIGYGESLGGMLAVDLLDEFPEVHLHELVFNATPDSRSSVAGGPFLPMFRFLHGGPISTMLLRAKQRQDVAHSPELEPEVNPAVAHAAEQDSIPNLTAPTAFGQLRYISSFYPGTAGQFAGRVKRVTFLHAPGDRDAFINNTQSMAAWRTVFGDTPFQDVTADNWQPGMHTPTPERPSPVIEALTKAATG